MLAAIVSFARPELGVWLTIQYIAGLDEGLAEAESIAADCTGESRIGVGVGGVGFHQHLGLDPCLVGVMVRIQPVIHKDEFSIGLGFISKAVFGARSRSFKRDLLASNTV